MTVTLSNRRRRLPFLVLCALLLCVAGPSVAGSAVATAVPSSRPLAGAVTVAPRSGFAGAVPVAGVVLSPGDPSSTLLAELNVVPVSGPSVDDALARVGPVLGRYRTLVATGEQAGSDLVAVALRRADGQVNLERLEAARAEARLDEEQALELLGEQLERLARGRNGLDASREALADALVEAYIGGNQRRDPWMPDAFSAEGRKLQYLGDALGVVSQRTKRLTAGVVELGDAVDAAGARLAQARAARRLVDGQLADQAAALGRLGDDAVRLESERVAAVAAAAALEPQVASAKVVLADARRTAQVVGADFPLVVLDAFVRAVRYEAQHRPACRLDWPLLAAVSRVESGHGTSGGSSVDALGHTRRILGPSLSPEAGFGVVTDSDDGLLDGDPVHDRAVGPMQFLPSSWKIYALDGDGDGVLDPFDYYDAALAAAEHLCRGGADVSTKAGTRAALFSYNHSDDYVTYVAAIRERYRTLSW